MEGDGGHPSLMGFLGTVDIKITQSEDLGLSLRQKTANVVVERKFREIDVSVVKPQLKAWANRVAGILGQEYFISRG